MIGFVDQPPSIAPHGDGFLVTFKSGESETAFMLTLHALSRFCGIGMTRVREAQIDATNFKPIALQRKRRARPNG